MLDTVSQSEGGAQRATRAISPVGLMTNHRINSNERLKGFNDTLPQGVGVGPNTYRGAHDAKRRGVAHRTPGGSRRSVRAKIRYTIRTSTPTNQAERPLLVTSAAVIVAMSIIATAPGQNCRVIGVGPTT